MQSNSYEILNVKKGARPEEIRAAFRQIAKSCHPDAAGQSRADVAKFINAREAYKKLMSEAVKTLGDAPEAFGKNWRLESEKVAGLDIHYDIAMVRPAGAEEVKIIIPWKAHDACPVCLGLGQSLNRLGSASGSVYRPAICPKCGGRGTVARQSRVEVGVTAEVVNKGQARLRKAGFYHPQKAQRGDLILNFRWVDDLPQNN